MASNTIAGSGLSLEDYSIPPAKLPIRPSLFYTMGLGISIVSFFLHEAYWVEIVYLFGALTFTLGFGMQMQIWVEKLARPDDCWNQYDIESGRWERVDHV